jgi:ribonuclease HII
MESLAALDDSKKLGEAERERLFPLIKRYALAYHVVFIPSAEVDRRGVHVANIEGMRRAVAGLPIRPGYVLSDGFRVPGLPTPSLPVIGGDAAAACIAAASVLAKVSRDRLMVAMDSEHPGYGFAEHKGYSTRAHSAALARLGPSRQHRYSFINVRRLVFREPGEHGDDEYAKMRALGPMGAEDSEVSEDSDIYELREGQLSR